MGSSRSSHRGDRLLSVMSAVARGEGAPETPDGVERATTPAATTFDRKKTIIGLIVTIVILAVVFLGVIPKIGSYSEAWESIKTIPGPWLAALVGIVVGMVIVYVWPYQAAIPELKYGPAFVVRQTSFTISNAVPAGGAVGLAMQYAMLASYEVPGATATAGIAITSVWSVFMTLGLPIMGVLALLITGQLEQKFLLAGVVGVAAIVGAVIVFWLILRSEPSARRVGSWGDRMARPITKRIKRPIDVTAAILHFREGIVDVVSARWRWITVSNVIVVLVQYLVLYVAIRSVGGQRSEGFNIVAGFAAFAISRLASMIPVTPGGLGTVDAALIGLLVTFGLDKDDALAADLVWRAASFVPQVLLGVVTFIWWRARQQRRGGL